MVSMSEFLSDEEINGIEDRAEDLEQDLDEHLFRFFKMYFDAVAEKMHDTSVEKGFWEEERNEGESIALMHSELSEALEAARHDNPESRKIPGFSHVEEEFADLLIRVMDWAHANGYDVAGAVAAKAAYNQGREYKHGKNF